MTPLSISWEWEKIWHFPWKTCATPKPTSPPSSLTVQMDWPWAGRDGLQLPWQLAGLVKRLIGAG